MERGVPPSTTPGDEARVYLDALREERESLEQHLKAGHVTRGEYEEVQEVYSELEARLRSVN